jgi:hypothetical protein
MGGTTHYQTLSDASCWAVLEGRRQRTVAVCESFGEVEEGGWHDECVGVLEEQ